MERHYGMDWLRIGAFALLILYHTGMVFVPWDFVVNLDPPILWATIPMFATNPWRMLLLFVISGFASRALIEKCATPGAFLRSRSARLLLPLLFAAIVIIPVQPWIELVVKHGYGQSFSWFWLNDYFRFGSLNGIILPTWQHLWFVVYLWIYTAVLAAGLLALRRWSAQTVFDRIFGGIGVLLIPVGWVLVTDLALFRNQIDTHNLVADLPAHLRYFPGFLFGFALARSTTAMSAIDRFWKIAAAIALACYATIVVIDLRWPGIEVPTRDLATLFHGVRAVDRWAAVIALIGLANTCWNHDHKWRGTLGEAVFPFYIVHQSIIVVVAWALLSRSVSPGPMFAIIALSTAAGSWLFYDIGRRIPSARRWIGLKPGMAHRRPPAKADDTVILRNDRCVS